MVRGLAGERAAEVRGRRENFERVRGRRRCGGGEKILSGRDFFFDCFREQFGNVTKILS